MKQLFLLFVVILGFFLIKQQQFGKLKRVDIESDYVIERTGTLFLPQTIQNFKAVVQPERIVISVSGKNYIYRQKSDRTSGLFFLEGNENLELVVFSGTRVKLTGTKEVRVFVQEVL